MTGQIQEKLDIDRREKTGDVSLSLCLHKHAEEVAAMAVEKGLKASHGQKMEVFEGRGTQPPITAGEQAVGVAPES